MHGSATSLISGGSSLYGSSQAEDRQANEVRRLKRELVDAREQVLSLSSQLSSNVSRTITFNLPFIKSYNNNNNENIKVQRSLQQC